MKPIIKRFLTILAILIVPAISTAQVNVQLPDTVAAVGDTLMIPLTVTSPLGEAVISSQFEVSFDTSLIKGLNVFIEGVTLPGSAGWNLEFNLSSGGISAGMAGADTLIGTGVLSYILLVVNEMAAPDQIIELIIDTLIFNQGSPVAVIQNGSISVISVGVDEGNESGKLVRSFSLSQNFPNPFNPTTIIRYALPKSADVLLTIFSLRGEEVYQFANTQTAGYHEIKWDGSQAVSGIYFYRLQAGDFVQTRKMVLLK